MPTAIWMYKAKPWLVPTTFTAPATALCSPAHLKAHLLKRRALGPGSTAVTGAAAAIAAAGGCSSWRSGAGPWGQSQRIHWDLLQSINMWRAMIRNEMLAPWVGALHITGARTASKRCYRMNCPPTAINLLNCARQQASHQLVSPAPPQPHPRQQALTRWVTCACS